MRIRLGYAVLNVFQRHWEGQGDPLYAVLSRRGNSTDWVRLEASEEEVDRLEEVAQKILFAPNSTPGEIRTAEALMNEIYLAMDLDVDEARAEMVKQEARFLYLASFEKTARRRSGGGINGFE